LSVLGGGTNSLFGPGGIVDGIGSVIGDVRNGQVGLGTILKGINTYNNARKIKNAKGQLKEELGGIVKDEIQKIGESAGTIANPVGNFSVGNAATTAALAGATIATAKGLIDEKNKNSTVVQNANIDTETYLTPSESTNLINNNPEVRTQIAANMYYKDIGSRKGLTVAESDLEFASASESVKNVYNSKASTNINKLVTEGYIKIDRASQNVNVSIESQGV
jgi:hypothetical protein